MLAVGEKLINFTDLGRNTTLWPDPRGTKMLFEWRVAVHVPCVPWPREDPCSPGQTPGSAFIERIHDTSCF